MILPMRKVCLLVQDKYRREAMIALREVGVVHIEKSSAASEGLSKAFEHKTWLTDAISTVKPYMAGKKNTGTQGQGGKENKRDAALAELIMRHDSDRKFIEINQLMHLNERERIAAWGHFDPAHLELLASFGLTLYLYELPVHALEDIPPEIRYIKIDMDKVLARIVVLDEKIPGMEPFHIPGQSLSQIEAELDEYKAELEAIDERMRGFACCHAELESEMADAESEIEFEAAMAELVNIEGAPPEHGVSYLKGYAPAENVEGLKKCALENGWALALYDPAPDDMPPTLLRSKPIARIIKPLFSVLGTIPGYWEYDISPSYLVFFSLFFAMILGDAAYGLLIMIVSAAFGIISVKKGGKLPDAIKLLMLLGFSTVVWGSINGSWFAIPRESLPSFMSALIIPPFNPSGPLVEFPLFLRNVFKLPAEVPTGEYKTRWSIQFFCFTVAVIQLTWARTKRIIKLLPSLAALAQAGWYLLMLGLYFLVLYMLLRMPFPPFAPALLGIGFFLILVFSEQKGGNFFANIGRGFGNFFQVFMKAVSCFADIISYIRLFAVGLAGSMIGQIFNSMAIPSEGLGNFGLGFLARLSIAAAILVFGHGLNLMLNSLSVIVHGVRLNLLEYAGNHLEMEWSGYEYSPFVSKQKNKQ